MSKPVSSEFFSVLCVALFYFCSPPSPPPFVVLKNHIVEKKHQTDVIRGWRLNCEDSQAQGANREVCVKDKAMAISCLEYL